MISKFTRIFVYIFIFLSPLIIISAFTGKNLDLGNLVYGINSLDIIEQINEVKSSAIAFNGIQNIADAIEQAATMIVQVLELIFVSPIRTIIDIYNLLFV